MDKLTPISIDELKPEEIINKCYQAFKESILNRNRPDLFGKKIYIPIEWYNFKAEAFWHVSSLNPKDVLNIYPCNNDLSYSLCNDNCISKTVDIPFKNGEIRALCYYRMIRVHWIRIIIDMANSGDSCLQIWKIRQQKDKLSLYIRYIYKEVDYLLVFEEKPTRYVFKSAYPVFYISSKKEHTRNYNNYIKNKSR